MTEKNNEFFEKNNKFFEKNNEFTENNNEFFENNNEFTEKNNEFTENNEELKIKLSFIENKINTFCVKETMNKTKLNSIQKVEAWFKTF